MVSSPKDIVQLDSSLERTHLEEATEELRASGLVDITWLERASLDVLQEELRRTEYHVFHYIGHGGFDPREDKSVLLLEGADEQPAMRAATSSAPSSSTTRRSAWPS